MSQPTHPCPGCDAPDIPYGRLACPECWRRLPGQYRWNVLAARGVNPGAHRKAVIEALSWYRDQRWDYGPREQT